MPQLATAELRGSSVSAGRSDERGISTASETCGIYHNIGPSLQLMTPGQVLFRHRPALELLCAPGSAKYVTPGSLLKPPTEPVELQYRFETVPTHLA
jgi:hypothetical protein